MIDGFPVAPGTSTICSTLPLGAPTASPAEPWWTTSPVGAPQPEKQDSSDANEMERMIRRVMVCSSKGGSGWSDYGLSRRRPPAPPQSTSPPRERWDHKDTERFEGSSN